MLTNCSTKQKYQCGSFEILRLDFLRDSFTKRFGTEKSEYATLELLTAESDSKKHVNVSYLQSLPENRNAVFQVASNFNGVESVSENISPDSKFFTQNYIR